MEQKDPTQDWLIRPDGIATRLREARERTGMTGRYFADHVAWAPSKVSRIENGKQMPTADDINTWATACDLDDAAVERLHAMLSEFHTARREWKHRLRTGQGAVQNDYNQLVAGATQICHFETAWIPGLLQTPDYARQTLAGIAALHGTSRDEVDGAVAVRMERQRYLYDPSKQFEFLIAEPVMRWLLCPPDVMRGQLDRLQTIVGLPNVRFGVLPMGVQLRTVPQNSFQLYDDVVYTETFTTEEKQGGEVAAKYGEILAKLWEEAVVGEDARALIVAAANGLPA